MTNIQTTKQTLRRELQARRNAITDRAQRSTAICETIAATTLFQRAAAIHCYLAIRSEVDMRPLLDHAVAAGKRIAVPVVVPGYIDLEHRWIAQFDTVEFTQGPLGTHTPNSDQPAVPGDWDLIIVPLLGFDRRGFRLGYGKGYYDRLLSQQPAPTMGVAFADQEVVAIPREDHDIPLDYIVTEQELLTAVR